ncbi:MAG: hypothetical protein ACRDZ4_18975 [Egibacteraceae bacterium]
MGTEQQSGVIPDWLYTVIVASLGIYFVIGAIVWSILVFTGRQMPDSFATILATIAGGLVGKLAPAVPRSAVRRSDGDREPSQ